MLLQLIQQLLIPGVFICSLEFYLVKYADLTVVVLLILNLLIL